MGRTTQQSVRLRGRSTKSIDDAAGRAVARALAGNLDPLSFELERVRGTIRDGRIAAFEVDLTLRVRAPARTPQPTHRRRSRASS